MRACVQIKLHVFHWLSRTCTPQVLNMHAWLEGESELWILNKSYCWACRLMNEYWRNLMGKHSRKSFMKYFNYIFWSTPCWRKLESSGFVHWATSILQQNEWSYKSEIQKRCFICTANITIIHSQFCRISNPPKPIVRGILIPNMKCCDVVYRPSLRDWLSSSSVIPLLICNLVLQEMKC